MKDILQLCMHSVFQTNHSYKTPFQMQLLLLKNIPEFRECFMMQSRNSPSQTKNTLVTTPRSIFDNFRDPLPDILFRLIPEQKWASFWGDMMVTACLIQLILMSRF